jgi:hypothetical protein
VKSLAFEAGQLQLSPGCALHPAATSSASSSFPVAPLPSPACEVQKGSDPLFCPKNSYEASLNTPAKFFNNHIFLEGYE